MTACIVCPRKDVDDPGHDPDYERRFLCCARAWARMAHALGPRGIPELVGELSGLGYVERDTGLRVPEGAARWPNTRKEDVAVLGRDPVANAWPAGPVTGLKAGPKVAGSGERSLPIRIDPTDLLLPARPASLAVAETGAYASDQIGHLSVATELEFWARDWADARGEHLPLPTVPLLSRWLLDRLEWACAHHHALDEFAGKLRQIVSALLAATGRFDAPPQVMDQPCPRCELLTLVREPDSDYIVCPCGVALTEEEYAQYLRAVIRDVTR